MRVGSTEAKHFIQKCFVCCSTAYLRSKILKPDEFPKEKLNISFN